MNRVRLALLSVFLALPVGCCHDLQGDYVTAMEDTYDSVLNDVRRGLYKPDANGTVILDKWHDANADARRVLDSDGE